MYFSLVGTLCMFKMSVYNKYALEYILLSKVACFLPRDVFQKYQKKHIYKWIRFCITLYYIYIAYYGLFILDFRSIDIPLWRNLKSHWWKCITVWNMVLQVRYFIMSFLIDYMDDFPKSRRTRRWLKICKSIQDYCFLTFDMPLCIFVCIGFWFICMVNKPLFFPIEMHTWIPYWYNHALHTNPALLIILQMFFYYHHNPPIKRIIFGLFSYCLIYIICLSYTKWVTGSWIYIVIGDVAENVPQLIIVFFVVGIVIPLSILVVCYKINVYLWSGSMKRK